MDRQESATQTLIVIADCNPFNRDNTRIRSSIKCAIMPERIKQDILKSEMIYEASHKRFIEERIVGPASVWEKMSKAKLLCWKDASKIAKKACPSKEVILKEDISLLVRLSVIARSQRKIDLQHVIAAYEFSCLPRSLFAADGSLLPSTDKSKLMSRIEHLPHKDSLDSNVMDISKDGVNSSQYLPHITPRIDDHIHHALIIDGIAVVHESPGHGLKQ